jgi:hypothetical protein
MMSSQNSEIGSLFIFSLGDLQVLRVQLSVMIDKSTAAKIKASSSKVRRELEAEIESYRNSWTVIGEEIKRRTLNVHRDLQEGGRR